MGGREDPVGSGPESEGEDEEGESDDEEVEETAELIVRSVQHSIEGTESLFGLYLHT